MDKKLFRSKMALFGDTNLTLAAYLGISPQRNSAKLNQTNGAEYSQGEIKKIKTRWKLTANEIDLIFFADAVS